MKPSLSAMKRIALPMVERDEDWQTILEEVKDSCNLEATEENREVIMEVIRQCEDEVANKS